MNLYRITYTRSDMPGYVGSTLKYASNEKDVFKYLGSKPDKKGYFRLKRGGVAQLKDIKIEK